MRFRSNFNCLNGPNVHFRITWKWTKIAFWHLIIIFEDKTKWIKNVFSKQFLHVIWKPWNTFRDQKVRFCVVVKNKFWKTWLFHFVPIDSKWEEEITHGDHNSGSEEHWEKYWNVWKFQKFSGGPLYLFLLNLSKLLSLKITAKLRKINTYWQISGKWARSLYWKICIHHVLDFSTLIPNLFFKNDYDVIRPTFSSLGAETLHCEFW